MAGFINRLKSVLAKTEPAASNPSSEDPLDYDQLVYLDAEDLAEQGILSAYQALLPRIKQFTDSLSLLARRSRRARIGRGCRLTGRRTMAIPNKRAVNPHLDVQSETN